ncbi:MAG TPA: histidine phosphatase family protein [Firmicutes bacterium]|nr:histidine phosphatase family protein [Bacillota bacterium]
MEKILYLIRHCEADGNLNRIFHGNYDSDITENGKHQLERLRRRFADIHLDALYSSPLRRAVKTAEAVGRDKNLEINICPGLIEINGGSLENRPWKDFPLLSENEAYNWVHLPAKVKMPGGETMQELYDRIWYAVLSIVNSEAGAKTIAAVSHGCAIRAFLCRALGYGIDRLNDVGWCDNTAVSKIVFADDGKCDVVYFNDASHLDSDLSTIEKQNWFKNSENYFNE